MQLCFSGAISADCVDVLTAPDHVVRQDRCILFVRCAGRDDVRTLNYLFGPQTPRHIKALSKEISRCFHCSV